VVTPLVRVETGTKTALLVLELSPSCPVEVTPQHWTPPFTTAQAALYPTDSAVAPLVRPETCAGTLLVPAEFVPHGVTFSPSSGCSRASGSRWYAPGTWRNAEGQETDGPPALAVASVEDTQVVGRDGNPIVTGPMLRPSILLERRLAWPWHRPETL
jgi:hypothetical protein